MIAGELEIRIAAVYDQLNKDLTAATAVSAKAGQAAGQQFGSGFETVSSGYFQKASDQLKTKFAKAFSGFNLAQNVAGGIEEGLRSGSWETALQSSLRSIPFGGLAEAIASAIFEGLTGAKAMEAEQAAMREREKINQEYRNRYTKLETERIQTVQQAEVDAAMEQDRRRGLTEKARLDIFNARTATNERLAQTTEKREKDKILEIQAIREKAIRDRLARELKAIDEAEAKEKEAIERKAKAEREAKEKQESERKAREIEKIDAEMKTRLDALREQQAAVQGSVGTIQTAHGAFKFASYTDAEKKQIDRSILEEIKTISATAQRMRDAVQVSGGFN